MAGKRSGRVRSIAMRPRRTMVKVHRWLAIVLMAWLAVAALTGAWLVERTSSMRGCIPVATRRPPATSARSGDRRRRGGAPRRPVYGTTMPRNGRGVYQVGGEVVPRRPRAAIELRYYTAYVDPGSGGVNGVADDEAGITWWLFRGHMYLWQDYGIFGVFDPKRDGAAPTATATSPAE